MRLKPKNDRAGSPRVVLLQHDLHGQIISPTTDVAYRMGTLRADLDQFTTGGMIVVGRKRQNTCFLKLLTPVTDGIVEIRSRDPKPSLRLVGGFAEIDVFVGLYLFSRAELKGEGSREWRDAIVASKSAWTRMFVTYPRVTGGTINDYLSGNFIDEDDIR